MKFRFLAIILFVFLTSTTNISAQEKNNCEDFLFSLALSQNKVKVNEALNGKLYFTNYSSNEVSVLSIRSPQLIEEVENIDDEIESGEGWEKPLVFDDLSLSITEITLIVHYSLEPDQYIKHCMIKSPIQVTNSWGVDFSFLFPLLVGSVSTLLSALYMNWRTTKIVEGKTQLFTLEYLITFCEWLIQAATDSSESQVSFWKEKILDGEALMDIKKLSQGQFGHLDIKILTLLRYAETYEIILKGGDETSPKLHEAKADMADQARALLNDLYSLT